MFITCFLIFFFYEVIYNTFSKNYSWYLIHLIVNTIAVLTVYEDIWNVFTVKNTIDNLEPTGGLFKISNPLLFLNCLISSLHLFHIKYALKMEDWMHHIFMTITLNICFFYLKPIFATCFIFFMNGLPGGIDYYLLIQVKRGKIKSIQEKKINTYLNNYIRAPGILIIIGLILPVLEINLLNLYCIFTTFMNAVYYNREVCVNYGIKSIES